MKKTVLDRRKLQIAAIMSEKSLAQINAEAGLSRGYIYECLDTNRTTLATVDAIANALGCSSFDLLVEIEADADTQLTAPFGVTEFAIATA